MKFLTSTKACFATGIVITLFIAYIAHAETSAGKNTKVEWRITGTQAKRVYEMLDARPSKGTFDEHTVLQKSAGAVTCVTDESSYTCVTNAWVSGIGVVAHTEKDFRANIACADRDAVIEHFYKYGCKQNENCARHEAAQYCE